MMGAYRPNMFKELQTSRTQQIIFLALSLRNLQYRIQQNVLDQESIEEIIVFAHASSEVAQSGQSKMLMSGLEKFGDTGRNGSGEDKVFGAPGVVRYKEAEQIAEMSSKGYSW